MMGMLSLLVVSATKTLLTSRDKGSKELLDRLLLLAMGQVCSDTLIVVTEHRG
jgi:hypothetical protein